MTENDRPRFALAVGAMLEAFGQESTRPRLHGYWLGLRSLSIEQVEQSVAAVLETVTDRFPPPPAKLRELVTGGPATEQALLAWVDVERAMPLGAYRHIDFTDRHINAAIRSLGGWPTLFSRCATTDGEKWYRVEFCKAYAAAVSRGLNGDVCRPLPGLSELQIIRGEKSEPVPVRIGSTNQKAIAGQSNQRRIECQS